MIATRGRHATLRRVMAATLALSLAVLPVTTYTGVAFAASSEEIQAQLDEAYAVLDDLAYSAQIAEAELGKANYDLDVTREEIAQLEEEIEANKQLLAEKKESLAGQVRASYKSGAAGLVDVVLGSTSYDDFVTRLFYANRISNQFAKTIDEVEALREQLDQQQSDLEQREQELVEQVAAAEDALTAMEAAQAEQAAYIDQLSEELKAAIEEERRKAAEEARRKAEEEARRAAEEEARRRAEEEAAAAAAAAAASSDDGSEYTYTVDTSTSSDERRTIAVNAALSQVGLAYVWGEQIPGVGFDCNGLTNWAWAQAGVTIPYTSGHYSYGQFQWLKASGRWVTSVSQLQLGDLVFYSYDGGYTCYHVAMYIGNGNIVHACDYRHGICVWPINECSGFCGGGSPI